MKKYFDQNFEKVSREAANNVDQQGKCKTFCLDHLDSVSWNWIGTQFFVIDWKAVCEIEKNDFFLKNFLLLDET
jgi:hypothetical protein